MRERTGLAELVVQLIVPALSALLAVSTLHLACNERPLLHAVLTHQLCEPLIFVWVPWAPKVRVIAFWGAGHRFAANTNGIGHTATKS